MKLSWRLMTGFIAVALASIHFLFVIAPGRSPAQSLKPAIRSQQVPESAKGSPAETKESLRSFVLSEDHESVFPERPLPEAERVLSRGAVTEREVTAVYVQEVCHCKDIGCLAVVGARYVTKLPAASQHASDSKAISKLRTELVDCTRKITPHRDETWERKTTKLREQERHASKNPQTGL